MNALHDKAFETGMLTITPDYIVNVSSELLKSKDPEMDQYFAKYHGKEIILPSRFLPDPELLRYHNNERFKP
jgi:putative restriction endonuclease